MPAGAVLLLAVNCLLVNQIDDDRSQACSENYCSHWTEVTSSKPELHVVHGRIRASWVSRIRLRWSRDAAISQRPSFKRKSFAVLERSQRKFSSSLSDKHRILFAPVSTAGIEGIFSIAGIILGNRNLRTIDSNFENRLFCNVNQFLVDELDSERAFENL